MASKPSRCDPFWLAREGVFGNSGEQLLECNPGFESRKGGAKTEMRPVTQREMPLDLSLDVEALGLIKLPLIEIGRCPYEENPCILGDRLAMQCEVTPSPTG